MVRDAALQWQIARGREFVFTYPVVAETFDFLNDANGQHVKPEHVWAALDAAAPGRVVEGGTGMGCNGFKGGIGTSSRIVTVFGREYTLGVLVQCNYGGGLHVLGVPVAGRGSNAGPEGTGRWVRISELEAWRLGAGGLIAESHGQFDSAEYQRQLQYGVGEGHE